MITLIFTLEGCLASNYLSDLSQEPPLQRRLHAQHPENGTACRENGGFFSRFAPKAEYLFSANGAVFI
jgi:hypothetical protein